LLVIYTNSPVALVPPARPFLFLTQSPFHLEGYRPHRRAWKLRPNFGTV